MEGFEGPRPPSVDELGHVLQFLDRNLRKENPWSIAQEYPTTYTEDNRENIRIIKSGTEVLSHAAIKTLIIKTPIGLFKAAAIGGVVTAEKYRQLGLGRKILEECIVTAEKQGHDFVILWTNLYDLYRKLGFELAGSEVSLVLEKPVNIPSNQKLRIHKGANVSAASIERVYSQHTVTNIRKVSEIEKFLRIPNSNVYTAWTADNQLLGYAVEGKGADLNGYIHEWGGGVNEIIQILNHILADQKKSLTIICPGHSQNLIRQLEPFARTTHLGYLGMIKILQLKNLVDKVDRFARNLGYPTFSIQKLLDQSPNSNPVRVFFGPTDSQFISKCDDKSREIIARVLPVPMWVWGWDSV